MVEPGLMSPPPRFTILCCEKSCILDIFSVLMRDEVTDFCGEGQAFVGPEPCLNGDRLGSGMERPRFRSSPCHLVVAS